MMKRAIQQNYELVHSAKKKVEDNKYEMLDKVKTGIQEYHTKLDQLEKEVTTEINNEVSETQAVLKVGEYCLQEAEGQLKALEAEFRVPTRPGKPGKRRIHLENLEISWNFEKINKYHGKMT